MAGFVDKLFGPDGIGGEPGMLGKVADHVASFGVDVGKAALDIPWSVATFLPDFAKDPEVFMGGGRLGAAGALLSKDFRKVRAAELKSEREWEKAKQTKEMVDWASGLFNEAPTDTAQGMIRQGLVAQGVDEAMLQPYASAAKEARHASRKAAAAAGMNPAGVNIADVDSARQTAQTGFAGEVTRTNQQQSSDLATGRMRLGDRLSRGRMKLARDYNIEAKTFGSEGKIAALENYTQTPSWETAPQQLKDKVTSALASRDPGAVSSVFSQIPTTAPSASDDSSKAFIRMVLDDPITRQDPEALPDNVRRGLEFAEAAGGDAADDGVRIAYEAIMGRQSDKGDMDKLTSTPFGRSLLTAKQGQMKITAGMNRLEEFKDTPSLFQGGAGLAAGTANFISKWTGMDSSEWTEQRKLLEQASGTVTAAYVQSISGATVPEAEFERLRKNQPDLQRDSYSTFYAKTTAIKAAAALDKELADAQINAYIDGDVEAMLNIGVQRAAGFTNLNDKLAGGVPDEADRQKYLTPEERGE